MLLALLFQMLLDAKHGWMVRFCGLLKTWVERGFGLRDLGFSQIVAEDDFWDIRLYHCYTNFLNFRRIIVHVYAC
jgi:hypothetical protein